ncbi:MAG TPA: 3-dehydroquinate synthase [Phycisphaerales bacterium]|nr:3-dehydroquinate synthase [Phycisphaerales bacterium]
MPTVPINIPGHEHEMTIEAGALRGLGAIVHEVAPHRRAMLIVDAALARTHGATAERSLRHAHYEVFVHTMTANEPSKILATVERMYAAMLASGVDRTTPVIALGGGVVGDTAGFAASTFLRGVPFIQVPTTLLAMVDAAIGGKTGINTPLPGSTLAGRMGKNLIGAFWQPRAIVADPETLRTLDMRHFLCGVSECIKHGVIADRDLLALIQARMESIRTLDTPALTDLIERSARIKIAIVEEDERESGRRALLNLGHTFAHAIEPIAELDLQHGEAVAIGMCAAAHAAVLMGRLSKSDAEQIESLIESAGLPRRLQRDVSVDSLLEAMMYDKKVARGKLRLVLPTSIGSAEVVRGVSGDVVVEAWRHVSAAPGAAR